MITQRGVDAILYCKHLLLLIFTATAAKSLQSCPTLCDPIEVSPPGCAIPGILQARTLKWVAISFSSAWKWKVEVKSLSHVRLFATPWAAAYQAPPSMGFSRQEYWSVIFTEQLLSVRLCWVFLSLFFSTYHGNPVRKTLSLILLTSKRTWEKYLLMTSQQVRGGATCYPGQSTFLVKMN